MSAEDHKQALPPGFQLGASLTIQTVDRRRERLVDAQIEAAVETVQAESRAASLAVAS